MWAIMSGTTLIEIFITFSFISLILLLTFKNIRIHFRNNDLVSTIVQLHFDKMILDDRIKELNKNKKDDAEGFIKFISESRDQAYKYIEDSQKLIKDYCAYFEKNIELLKSNDIKDIKYKIVIKELEKYFIKLRTLLPKEENNGR